MSYNPKTYRKDGGDTQVIASGGKIEVESGGIVDIESGGAFKIAGTQVTASAAELNTVDVTAGAITASKALVLSASRALTFSSSSTSGSTSVEPFSVTTTMTGAGGVGGRARFELDTNVALGGWANALKGITVFGATGAVTGLGSAVCAEMTLSAGTAAGTYAPLEIELNLGSGALTGTQTSLIYASVNGDDAGKFDDNGVILSLNGITIGAGDAVQASAVSDINSTHAMKIAINGTLYYIPLHTAANFGG